MRGPEERRQIARRLGVSAAAVELCHDCELFDLHIDSFILVRLFGWDFLQRHSLGLLRGHYFRHADLPRYEDSGLAGGMFSITTNPFRTAAGRWAIFQQNVRELRALVERSAGRLAIVRDLGEYRAARARGAVACLVSVQGGNAFDAAPGGVRAVEPGLLVRVTLVHLLNSSLGATSAPFSRLRRAKGLSARGREMVQALNAGRVFVDLAHIHPDAFWDAVEVHDRAQPLIATHTGVSGVTPHWRNLDDRQLKAIADTGGTIGLMYARNFLEQEGVSGPALLLEHMRHVARVVGDDFISLGTDYDGAVVPPHGLESADSFPRLVQAMLDARFTEERIRKILGGNFLRAFSALRP